VQIAGFAGSGGSAKQIIQAGLVRVNGQVETRRSHHVHAGDRIAFEDDEVELTHHAD
jgi:ribosome-associated protein